MSYRRKLKRLPDNVRDHHQSVKSDTGIPRVYILLINYNGHDDTIECLNSLSGITYDNYNILVVDNASEKGSVVRICNWLEANSVSYDVFESDQKNIPIVSKVTVIKSNANLGFGGANNIGLKIALDNDAPLVLLLNNDTVVQKDFLEHLVNTAMSNGKTIVGGKIYYMNNHKKIWYCGGLIDFIRGAAYHIEEDMNGTFEVPLITGCLALINMTAIKDVGFFDERFFLNVEDWDMSYRMRKAGWTLVIDTNAKIFHRISGSIGGPGSLRNLYYFHRNRLLFFKKHLRPASRVFFFLCQTFFIIPLWMIRQIFIGDVTPIKACLLGTSDFLFGRFGKSGRV